MYRIEHDIPDRSRDTMLRARAVLEDVLRVAKTLPVNEQVMVTMRFRDGYTFREIAAVCGCHEMTAMRRIKRICKKLCDVKRSESEAVLAAIA